jgi:kynurenine formamidase
MKLIDLTLTAPGTQRQTRSLAPEAWYDQQTIETVEWPLAPGPYRFTARIHFFEHWGMAGTYIDFPGHIKETDDGADAASVPAEKLYRVPASVIRLDRADGSGRIGAAELAAACPVRPAGGALILNALGARRFDEIRKESVYLGKDAVRWIADTGIHLFVSDVYENSVDPQGVFLDLFAAGIYTVCLPVNLHLVTRPTVRLTALPARFTQATQLPCRVVAELEG